MKKKQIDINFPISGLNRKGSYRQQKPYSTADCLNVRADDAIGTRERGGSRPGLMLSHVDNLGGPIRMLYPMTLALGDGFTNFSDIFDGTILSDNWTQASWETASPEILSDIPAAAIDHTVESGAVVLFPLLINSSSPYTVEMLLVPWSGKFAGKYRLFMRMNNSTPDITQDGVMVELDMSGSDGSYSGFVQSTISGVTTTTPLVSGTLGISTTGWFSVEVTGNNIVVFWNGVQITVGSLAIDSQSGLRVGFGMECDVDGGLCLANVFRVQYYSTGNVNQFRAELVASAAGNLYYESTYGRMTEVSSELTLEDDLPLVAAQDGQGLYIADYGDVSASGTDGAVAGNQLTATSISDWTAIGILTNDMVVVISNAQETAINGTYKISSIASGALTLASAAGAGAVAYRIERAPKIYDPLTNVISIMTAILSGTIAGQTTPGQVPTGCPVICRYIDRIVLAGAEIAPNVWYMSRKGYPLDWDYGQLDALAAVAGDASPAGVPGEPITALIAHSDDYMVIGCTNSLWRMMGDPGSGGTLGALSHAIGIVGPKAWCLCPDGTLVFLSQDGLYSLDAGGDAYPTPLSRENLPREFLNLNPNNVTACLEYDIQAKGVHIFLTSTSSNLRTHWFLDNAPETSMAFGVSSTNSRRAFWPVSLVADHEPTCTCTIQASNIEESGVIVGGRDGYLRKFHGLSENDCGTVFESYVIVGPIALNADMQIGTLLSIDATMGDDSGDVDWDIRPSLTFEDSNIADSQSSGTYSAGVNATTYPDGRGQAFVLELNGTGRKWAVEQITGIIKLGGKRRIA